MYAIVRTDNMSGTDVGKDIATGRFYAGSSVAAIENGNIVTLGDYLDGEREVRKATAPALDTKLRDLYLVASPEVIKDKTYYGLGDYINEAGANIVCIRLTPGDIFSVTKEAIDGSPAKDSVIEAMAGTKLKAVPTNTGGSTKIGKVVAVEGNYFVIEVA